MSDTLAGSSVPARTIFVDAARITSRGMTFLEDPDAPVHTYAAIREAVLRTAAGLRGLGIADGERVALIVPGQHDFVRTFLGTIVAGLVPVPLAPPFVGQLSDYRKSVEHILRVAHVSLLIGHELVVEELERDRPPGLRCLTIEQACSLEPVAGEASLLPDDIAFIQFTSGSTSEPKGVTVTHRNITSNVRAIAFEGARLDPESDRCVSWLPMFHDMGLIGFVLVPLAMQIAVWYIPTLDFLRRPGVWCQVMSDVRGTVSFAPTFAYARIARKMQPGEEATLDLSPWRIAGCGAEPVSARALRDFAKALEPARFSPRAFLPAYGLAESTLAVCFADLESPPTTTAFSRNDLTRGLATPASADDDAVEIVALGRPFAGHELRIVDAAGNIVVDGCEGEIQLRGPSVSPGYYRDAAQTEAALDHGWLRTGDLGVEFGGQLYVTGRTKDTLVIFGRNYHPQDIEEVVGEQDGVRAGRVVAFGIEDDDSVALVVGLEAEGEVDFAVVQRSIRSAVNRRTGLRVARVVVLESGAVAKTSSGKVRRSHMRRCYLDGSLASSTRAAV